MCDLVLLMWWDDASQQVGGTLSCFPLIVSQTDDHRQEWKHGEKKESSSLPSLDITGYLSKLSNRTPKQERQIEDLVGSVSKLCLFLGTLLLPFGKKGVVKFVAAHRC